jgi:hypothetical protein
MNLLTQLKKEVLDPLVESWGPFFLKHGLDISKAVEDLEKDLERPLPIDRTVPGFEHLALAAYRAIEPGKPALSFLYHALASSHVSPHGNTSKYPTLEQLDVVENYIYSRARARLNLFSDPVVAIFAYQYREPNRTTHRMHADLAFSRTGIARIGNEDALYVPERRGFEPRPSGEHGFRAMPARYAVFIAERRPQPPDGSVMRAVTSDAALTFLFPVHKLFPGNECLFELDRNQELVPLSIPDLMFVDCHVSEKLARIHHHGPDNLGYIPSMTDPEFDLQKAPFVRDSRTDPSLVRLERAGSSVLVVPMAQPIVSVATQSVMGKDELVRFIVPKPAEVHLRRNRYWSTFEIPADGNSRAAPEYVNIRTEVSQGSNGFVLTDLNTLPREEFEEKLSKGGYEAAHFIDNSCDGALTIEPIPALGALPLQPAYSLVTAVDYFPEVDQLEIEEWLEKRSRRSIGMADIEGQFPMGGPQPMSDGRFEWRVDDAELSLTRQLPNCGLPHPVRPGECAFSLADPASFTATAIVGAPPVSKSIETVSHFSRRAPSWLPDGASDVFAPGWDVSQHVTGNQNMYAAYGLGSPFPEDAKLCAALNSFWPAVAPDSARTYGWRPPIPWSSGGNPLTTAIPLTDAELGYHPQHPRSIFKEVTPAKGWDGDYGPFIVSLNTTRFVNASNPMRADQTRAALEGTIGFSGLDAIGTVDFITRMEALRWCQRNIAFNGFDVRSAWLVAFESVGDWSTWKSQVWPIADIELEGTGMIFLFASTSPGEEEEIPPFRRLFPIRQTLEVHMSGVAQFSDLSLVRKDGVTPTVFYRLDAEPFAHHGAPPTAPPSVPAAVIVDKSAVELADRPDTRTQPIDTRLPQ